MKRAIALLAVVLGACTAPAEPLPRVAPQPAAHAGVVAPGAARAGATAPRAFGAPLDEERPLTQLSTILAAPDRYRDQVVRTEGEIAQVCQRMGCWMELREGANGPAVRVPMAGHRFFLPRDVAGRRATMEGRVVLAALSDEARAHLASEGATETASALAIHASGVVVH